MIPPTPAQARILDALRRLTTGGVSPTYREIMADTGLTNIGAFHRMLTAMRERGLVAYEYGRARSIRIVGSFEGLELLADAELLRLQKRVRETLRERGL